VQATVVETMHLLAAERELATNVLDKKASFVTTALQDLVAGEISNLRK